MSACELGASQALKGSAQRCPAPRPRLQAPGSRVRGRWELPARAVSRGNVVGRQRGLAWVCVVKGRQSGHSQKGFSALSFLGWALENNSPAVEKRTRTFLGVSGKPGREGQALSWFSRQTRQTSAAPYCPSPGYRFATGNKHRGGQLRFTMPMTRLRS